MISYEITYTLLSLPRSLSPPIQSHQWLDNQRPGTVRLNMTQRCLGRFSMAVMVHHFLAASRSLSDNFRWKPPRQRTRKRLQWRPSACTLAQDGTRGTGIPRHRKSMEDDGSRRYRCSCPIPETCQSAPLLPGRPERPVVVPEEFKYRDWGKKNPCIPKVLAQYYSIEMYRIFE